MKVAKNELKKIIALPVIGSMMFSFVSCGTTSKTSGTTIGGDSINNNVNTTVLTQPAVEEPENNTNNEPIQNYTDEDLGWQTISCTATDGDGYTINLTLKISGWMQSDDTARINAAWNQVTYGPEFSASPSEMGFHDGQIYLQNNIAYVSTYYWYHDWNDVIYAVGYIDLENVTNGFSITSSNTHSVHIDFGNSLCASIKLFYASSTQVIYADQNFGTDTNQGWYGINALMQSDNWRVPFVIAFPLNQTPNHPNGDPDPSNCELWFGYYGDTRTRFSLPFTWE